MTDRQMGHQQRPKASQPPPQLARQIERQPIRSSNQSAKLIDSPLPAVKGLRLLSLLNTLVPTEPN